MKIFCLDCGLTTGWAVWFGNAGRIESGVQTFAARRGESPGIRFLYFRTWIERMINRVSPDLIVYEMSHHRGGAATELQVGMTTRVQEMCSILKLEYMKVNASQLKKYATGAGRASKEDMVKAADRLFQSQKNKPGRTIVSHDEADAIVMAAWAVNEFEDEIYSCKIECNPTWGMK